MYRLINSDPSRPAGRLALLAATMIVATAIPGCSSQQLYGVGQSWQRQECNRINDTQDRNRCMASANTSHDDYTRQAESAKSGK